MPRGKKSEGRSDATVAGAEPSPTIARYLEAIFYIDAEGETVRAARLAEWLGVSQPTTSQTLQRMVRDGLVEVSAAKEVALTRRGRAAASRIVRTHRIAERWLTDVLGFDWVRADQEAGKLEHAMSDDVAERLFELIGRPATCPHGNPIPGGRTERRRERALSTCPPRHTARVRRISEVAEHDTPELLQFLSESRLLLDVEVEVVGVNLGAGTQTVRAGRREITMALDVAEKIWVE